MTTNAIHKTVTLSAPTTFLLPTTLPLVSPLLVVSSTLTRTQTRGTYPITMRVLQNVILCIYFCVHENKKSGREERGAGSGAVLVFEESQSCLCWERKTVQSARVQKKVLVGAQLKRVAPWSVTMNGAFRGLVREALMAALRAFTQSSAICGDSHW